MELVVAVLRCPNWSAIHNIRILVFILDTQTEAFFCFCFGATFPRRFLVFWAGGCLTWPGFGGGTVVSARQRNKTAVLCRCALGQQVSDPCCSGLPSGSSLWSASARCQHPPCFPMVSAYRRIPCFGATRRCPCIRLHKPWLALHAAVKQLLAPTCFRLHASVTTL